MPLMQASSLPRLSGLDPAAIGSDLERDGFAVIQFPEPDLERMAEDIWQSLQPHYDWEGYRCGRESGLRVPDAWTVNENVRRIATNPVQASRSEEHTSELQSL